MLENPAGGASLRMADSSGSSEAVVVMLEIRPGPPPRGWPVHPAVLRRLS